MRMKIKVKDEPKKLFLFSLCHFYLSEIFIQTFSGPDIKSMMIVSERSKMKLNNVKVPPLKPHLALPDGLKVRFTTFGTGSVRCWRIIYL